MWLSLIGFIICVAIMFLIDWITSLVTFIIIIALYLIVVYRKPGMILIKYLFRIVIIKLIMNYIYLEAFKYYVSTFGGRGFLVCLVLLTKGSKNYHVKFLFYCIFQHR